MEKTIKLPLVGEDLENFVELVATKLATSKVMPEGLRYGSKFKVVCNLPTKTYNTILVSVVGEDGVGNIIRRVDEIKAASQYARALGDI